MKRKQESGITLLVLVITIIIIIILASITMNMVFGENGLVEKAELAKNMTEEGTQKEQGDLANIAIWLNEVIYGEDSGEDTGANEEEPGTNNIDTNEIDTNSVETNTVEPPPVEIPDGDEEGAIIFGTPTWGEGKASVTISTDTEYKIEYQKNVTTGKWTELEMAEGTKQGIVTDLTHGEIIYARLTDGINTGKETSIRITDSVVPQVTVTPGTITSSTVKVEIETVDNESGMQETVNYTYYIKKSTEGDGNYRNDGNNTNANFTFTGLEQGTSYDIKIEVQGDKAGNIGIGTLTEQRTQSIPGGETGLEEGAIKFGTPIWSNGTASVMISTNTSYTIEYQKGTGAPEDGSWQTITNNGNVTGINHNETVYARLTDGLNYGEYASITIKDTIAPSVEIIEGEITHESIEISVTANDNETGLATENTYKYFLNNELKATKTEATYTYEGLMPETAYDIKVEVYDKAGNVGTETKNINTIEEQAIEAGDIAKNPTEYYGKEVEGYICQSNGVEKWRIYHADENNIYLIADNFITYDNAARTEDGISVGYDEVNYSYKRLYFKNITSSYAYQNRNANWIGENSKGAQWLSQYIDKYGDWSNNNVKATAYLMDTNIWNIYAGEEAEYVMGSPTIELFCASYKATHPDKYIECEANDLIGYTIKWSDTQTYDEVLNGLKKDELNGIYSNSEQDLWVASPAKRDTDDLLTITSQESINTGDTQNVYVYAGLRPIVCLKANTQLEKLENGNYVIKSNSIKADEISKNALLYYGKEVKGYTCDSSGVEKWRIYYADENNIYLVADENCNIAPNGKNGTEVTAINEGYVGYNLKTVIQDYPNGSTIKNSKASKWLSQYSNGLDTNTNENIRAVSYMLDTDVWSIYAGKNAEYAIGSPTIEMFCASYKDTHPSEYIECQALNNGYGLKRQDDENYGDLVALGHSPKDEFNNIYGSEDISNRIWIASPSNNSKYDLIALDSRLEHYSYSSNSKLWPVVCLKPDVQLSKQTDGGFVIVE